VSDSVIFQQVKACFQLGAVTGFYLFS